MSEFRTKPGVNRTYDVAEALIHAPKGEVLKFEKGVYDFWIDGTYREYPNPGCNTNGDNVVIKNCKM